MQDALIQLTPQAIALIAIVMGLVQLVKLYVENRWAPLSAVILGVAGSFLIPAATWQITLLTGLIIGLTACGLYSGVKTTVASGSYSG